MLKLGNIIISISIILIIIFGIGVMSGFITKTTTVIPAIMVLSLIFIGAGSSIKKRA